MYYTYNIYIVWDIYYIIHIPVIYTTYIVLYSTSLQYIYFINIYCISNVCIDNTLTGLNQYTNILTQIGICVLILISKTSIRLCLTRLRDIFLVYHMQWFQDRFYFLVELLNCLHIKVFNIITYVFLIFDNCFTKFGYSNVRPQQKFTVNSL